jgi:hypothetical protein
MKIQEYQAHVAKLAEELGCRLEVADSFRTAGMMYVESGYVEVPPTISQIDYLINLHELGHVFHGHTQGRPPHSDKKFYFENGVLKSEAQAWEFALDKCIDEIQEKSRLFMWDACLGSYYQDAVDQGGRPQRLYNGNRHHVEFIYDEPDEYFTSIVKRIFGGSVNFTRQYKH